MPVPKILVVLTNYGTHTHEGKEIPMGWWLSELAHPYLLLKDRAEFTFASPQGGLCPVTPYSALPENNDAATLDFLHAESHLWENTRPLSAVRKA